MTTQTIKCPYCGSDRMSHVASPKRADGSLTWKYQCKDCGRYKSLPLA